jgi:hypothetical protein
MCPSGNTHGDTTGGPVDDMTEWLAKPEGLCKGAQCVPLPTEGRTDNGDLDITIAAQRLGMPLVHDENAGQWALGPESGGRVLSSAEAPDLILPDANGKPFELGSLEGRKVLLLAWASW